MSDQKSKIKQKRRLLKLLARHSSKGIQFRLVDGNICIQSRNRLHNFKPALIDATIAEGLVCKTQSVLSVTGRGLEVLENVSGLVADNLHPTSNLDLCRTGYQKKKIQVNRNEAPLMRLYSRRTKAGISYISTDEFHAGERLRQDFERGQLQPRITANYECVIASSSKSAFGPTSADISDFAVDARTRISNAIDLLGPELAGVALDICCFLKGFELVERERCWPPRSAKLMLKTALGMLSKHYGIAAHTRNTGGKIQTWGSSDYRPSVGL